MNAGWPPTWKDGCLKADALALCAGTFLRIACADLLPGIAAAGLIVTFGYADHEHPPDFTPLGKANPLTL